MPIIRGNAKDHPPIITVSIFPSLPLAGSPADQIQFGMSGLQCRALLDTGADGTSVSIEAAQAAGLLPRGKRLVTGIGGQNYHRSWATYIGFYPDADQPSFPVILEDPFLAIQMPTYHAFEVIIGRDILMKGTFVLRSNGDFEWDLPI